MAIDTPARHIYSGDGSTRVFPIPTYIQGDDYIRIEINGVHQADRSQWDIVNNSIIFVTAPISEATIDVQVATSVEALAELGSITNIDIVAGSIAGINSIASNLDEILLADANAIIATTKASEASTSALVATTKASEASASATSASSSATTATTKANEASTSASTATTKASEAVASAITASTKASEASASATSASSSATTASAGAITSTTKANEASTSAINALASENKAKKWADESEDVPVESGLYSAKHWAVKAADIVGAGLIDDVSPSTSTVFSSTKSNNTYEPKNSNIQGHISNTTNPHNVTKGQVGLSNVDNTSDVNKPISIATQSALDLKADDNTAFKLTGNQTVNGVKTFTSSPIVPTPTTDFQVATKKYVDDRAQAGIDSYQGPYGISYDYATDTYIRTGAKGYTAIQSLMRRCVLNADGTVNYYLNPDNSNFKADGTTSVLTGADGNVMVEIPLHYIKVETVGNVDSFSVSLTLEEGYVLDPAFLKWNGTAMVEVPYRYFRAYEGFVSGGKLLSVSGVTPTRTQTIATFRTQAMANGAGWHLTDWNLLNTIKRLCYIEFCDFIVTKYLGNGNDTGTDYGITTGQSNALGNRSSNSTHNDKYMSYRGIENMYADIWEFVDGVNVNNYQFYVNGKYSTFQSDVFTGDYVAKGPLTVAGASNSLIKRCAVSYDGGFIPTVVGGSTTTFYGDTLWSVTGARIALYGGAAHNGASAGLGSLYVSNASSSSNADVGAAVCR